MNRMAVRTHQRGASLLLALLLLALLSILVTHVLQANQWQRRIASHEIAGARAEAAAQSALSWAEQWLMRLPGDAPPTCLGTCNPQLMNLGTPPLALKAFEQALELNEGWWLANGHADGFDPLSGQLQAVRRIQGTPIGRWVVILLHDPAETTGQTDDPGIHYYRILARAVPAGRGQPVLIETIMARPWGSDHWRDGAHASGTTFCAQTDAPQPCGRLRWQQRP